MTLGELVAEVLAKRDAIDAGEVTLKSQREELARLEDELSERMNEEGFQSFKAADGRAVYKSRELQVNVLATNRAAVVDACRTLGLEELVKVEVPTTSLKARIREWMGDLGDKEQIPEILRPLVNIHEGYAIRVRKS